MITEVFEVEDVDRSVAAFEHASLTTIAARAAADVNATLPAHAAGGGVAVLGTGSSNVGGRLPPDPVHPIGGGEGRFGRLERLHGRLQGRLDRVAERIDHSGLGARVGGIVGSRTRVAERIAGALAIAATTSVALGALTGGGHTARVGLGVFLLVAGLVGSVIVGCWLAFEKIKATSEWTPRLLIAGLAAATAVPAIWVMEGAIRSRLGQTPLALLLVALLCDWVERFHAGRRGMVSVGSAFKVGLFAFIAGAFFECNAFALGGGVFVASLLVQMVAGAWPVAPAPAPAAPPPPPPAAGWTPNRPAGRVVLERPAEQPPPVPTHPAEGAMPAPALPARSHGARMAWMLLSVPLFISSVLLFIACGLLARRDADTAAFCMAGVTSAGYALFALSRSLGAFRRGVWMDLFRPFTFVTGLAGAASCGIGAGLLASGDAELFAWIAGVIVCAAAAVFVWLIPVAPATLAPPTPQEVLARDRRRGKWMLGSGIGLFCWLGMVIPILDGVLTPRHERMIIPAVSIPVFAGGVVLCTFGGMRLSRTTPKEKKKDKPRVSLPLVRVIEVDALDNLQPVLDRHLAFHGYQLSHKSDLLWCYTRGDWWGQFYQSDVRQWGTSLKIAAYELPGGGYRLTCQLDVDRGFESPSRKQFAVLEAEMDQLQGVLGGRPPFGAVVERDPDAPAETPPQNA
jgi:hypothetical protein